jgi:hypothetical protein
MLKLPSNLFDDEFPRQFKRFTSAFDGFARQVSLVLGSVNPNNNIRSFLRSSSLFMSSNALKAEWVDFIDRLNRIADTDVERHFTLIGQSLSVLFSGILNLHRATIERQRNDVTHSAIDQLQLHFTSLRTMIFEVTHRPMSRRFDHFDQDHFDTIVNETIRIIAALYDCCCPRTAGSCDLPGRQEMVTAASTIGTLMHAAARFSPQINALKNDVIQLNGELCLVHDRLNLKFDVSLTISEQKQVPEQGELERLHKSRLTTTSDHDDEHELTMMSVHEDEPQEAHPNRVVEEEIQLQSGD